MKMCAWELVADELDDEAMREFEREHAEYEEDLEVTEELNAYEHMYTRNMRT